MVLSGLTEGERRGRWNESGRVSPAIRRSRDMAGRPLPALRSGRFAEMGETGTTRRMPERARIIGNVIARPLAPPLLILGLAIVMTLTANVADGLLAILAAVNALACIVGIMKSSVGGLRPVAAVFYIFTFSWLGVAPIYQLVAQRVAWGDTTALLDRNTTIAALLMNVTATFAFMLGVSRANHSAARPLTQREARPAVVRGWALLAIVIALVVISPYAIAGNGGLGTLFSSRADRNVQLVSAGLNIAAAGGVKAAVVSTLPGALAVSGALLAVYRIKAGWTGVTRVLVADAAALVISLAGVIVFANPFSNTRFIAAAAIVPIVIAWWRPRGGRSAALFVAGGFIATLLLYPLANVFRTGKSADFFNGAATYTTIDFDGFQQVINSLKYVEDIGLSWGAHIVSAIAYPVPRSLWADKALPASIDVASHVGYHFTNLSLPIHAELYIEYGWVGVIAGLALLGYVAGRVDHAWLREPDTTMAAFAPYFSVAMLSIIRGPLGAQVPVYLTVLILLYLGFRRPSSVQNRVGDIAREVPTGS